HWENGQFVQQPITQQATQQVDYSDVVQASGAPGAGEKAVPVRRGPTARRVPSSRGFGGGVITGGMEARPDLMGQGGAQAETGTDRLKAAGRMAASSMGLPTEVGDVITSGVTSGVGHLLSQAGGVGTSRFAVSPVVSATEYAARKLTGRSPAAQLKQTARETEQAAAEMAPENPDGKTP